MRDCDPGSMDFFLCSVALTLLLPLSLSLSLSLSLLMTLYLPVSTARSLQGLSIATPCPSALESLKPECPDELIKPADQQQQQGAASGKAKGKQAAASSSINPAALPATTAAAAAAAAKGAAKFLESLGHDTVLAPQQTVRLSKAACAWRPWEGKGAKPEKNPRLDAAFTVEETYLVTGARSLFSTEDTRKVVLRTSSQEKMVDWCVLIKGASK